MNLDLYIDLEGRRLVAGPGDAGSPVLPPFTQGDVLGLRLHFLQWGTTEIKPDFSALKVGLGWIDRAPASGTWRLACDGEQTADLSHTATKAAVASALNALASVIARGGVAVEAGGAPNIYQIRWNNRALAEADADLTVEENLLAPKCFSRVLRYETDRGWLHLVKVFQAPIAFTDQFLFPAPPACTCALVRTGTGARNAVAALAVPDGAAGSLELTWGGLSTVILPVSALSATAIAAALNDLYSDGVARFAATNPRRGVFYIECVGPLGLAEQPAPGVTMHDQNSLPSPVGVLSLDVPGAELALNGAAKVSGLTLEGEVTIGGETLTLFQQPITLYNDMIDTPMALAADPAWLEELKRPVATVDYDPEQTVVGMLGYQDFAGDGVADAWLYTHNLSTLNVHITVRDNVSGLRVPDNLYTAEIVNANQVRVTFPEPPAEDQYVVIISAANADSHYNPHGHAIADVDGLGAALAALSAAGNPLELWPVIPLDKLPSIPASKISAPLTDAHIPSNVPRLDSDGYVPLALVPPEVPRQQQDGSLTVRLRSETETTTLVGADGKLDPKVFGDLARVPGFVDAVKTVIAGGGADSLALAFALPTYSELYPGRATAPQDPGTLDATALQRPGGLLPAIHDATVADLTIPLPAAGAPYTGNVFLNASGADLALPGGMGRKGSTLKAGEHAACDGRLWYRVVQEGATTSWHARDFDRELVMLDVNEAMFPVGAVFSLVLDFQAQILRSETRAQWVLLVETGAFASVASPAGTNISGITWSATPVISCPIHLTPIRTPHTFGVQFTRGAEAITGKTKLYRGAWTTTETVPAGPGFAVRARLARFDTEDGLADPRGYVFLAFNPNQQSLATIV